ncbi:MAG: hypothetical protein Q8R01_09165 [Ramlibacter sp.]|nr:hypothetical protein [Ramlibacter sp.]
MIGMMRKSANSAFASRTVAGHLIRGAMAFALLYAAVSQQHTHPLWALLAGGLALVAMRGCPVCWTIGLVEALVQRWRR